MFGRFLSVSRLTGNALRMRSMKPIMASRLSSGGVDANPGLAVPKHGRKESEDEFDQRYVNYFNRKDID
ncbi:unnamed protein product, partial [Medioppia subpectinata]